MNLSWFNKAYEDLTVDEFHDIVDLRIRVFVVEQNCPYPDIDGLDRHSRHIFARDEEGIIQAYLRIVFPGKAYKEPAIGRVITKESARGTGLGHEIMKRAMEWTNATFPGPVRLSAQNHLRNYYQKHGFHIVSDIYTEDDIPHVEMLTGEKAKKMEDRKAHFEHRWLELKIAKQKFIEHLGKFSTDEIGKNPSDGGWSALQVLNHVILSERGTLGYMLKKTKADVKELPFVTKEERDRNKQLMHALKSEAPYKAPLVMPDPEDPKPLQDQLEYWEAFRLKLGEFFHSLPDDIYGRFIFRHPLTGPMNLDEVYGFLTLHLHHHQYQLDRILKDLRSA